MNTFFHYMYRDAANHKSHGAVLLEGDLTERQRSEIVETFEAGEFFVAEQIGLPPLYGALFSFSGGRTEDDHTWHSFVRFEPSRQPDAANAPHWRSAGSFHETMSKIGEWDISLSPNYG